MSEGSELNQNFLKQNKKPPFYKNIWFWVVVFIFIITSVAGANLESSNTMQASEFNQSERGYDEESKPAQQDLEPMPRCWYCSSRLPVGDAGESSGRESTSTLLSLSRMVIHQYMAISLYRRRKFSVMFLSPTGIVQENDCPDSFVTGNL